MVRGWFRRTTRPILDYLPKGKSLPDDAWRVRHRTLSYLLFAHVGAVLAYGFIQREPVTHLIVEGAIVGVFAVVGWAAKGAGPRRQVSSAATAVGLVVSSAVLVHLADGVIEMHFHFFVMVGILTLYQDWVPFLLAIGFVVFHHGLVGTLAPAQVYNHPAAVAHPFRWALVHGLFVLAASVASVVAWKLNEEQALKDGLTRLANRRLFRDRLGHALARAQRSRGLMAVLYIDLDGFKGVNDAFGHAGGDQLLTRVAERLRAIVRPSDTAARLGGDEFAVLVEDVIAEAEASYVAERILAALAAPFFIHGTEVSIGASIGIALNEAGSEIDELLKNADAAMYTAKSEGKGRCQVFASGPAEAPRTGRQTLPAARQPSGLRSRDAAEQDLADELHAAANGLAVIAGASQTLSGHWKSLTEAQRLDLLKMLVDGAEKASAAVASAHGLSAAPKAR